MSEENTSTNESIMLDVDDLSLDPDQLAKPVARGTKEKRAATKTKASPRKRAKPSKAKIKVKKSKYDIFNEPDRLLGPTQSPIYKDDIDIQAILNAPEAQPTLSLHYPGGYPLAGIPIQDVKDAIATFKDDGRQGKHDEHWLQDALVAAQERQEGRFDEFLRAKFIEEWGEESEELSEDENTTMMTSKPVTGSGRDAESELKVEHVAVGSADTTAPRYDEYEESKQLHQTVNRPTDETLIVQPTGQVSWR